MGMNVSNTMVGQADNPWKEKVMSKIATIGTAALFLTITACADLSDTEQRAVTGTAVGAAGGAAVGALAGNTALGLAVGTAGGLATGLLVDKYQKDKESAYNEGYEAGKQSN
jgi:osmotically inducible lipoprotein OsmB